MSLSKTVSKRLKEARERIGYTEVKAARLSKISSLVIRCFERGTVEPTFAQLARLAEIYRLTPKALMGDKPITRGKCLRCR